MKKNVILTSLSFSALILVTLFLGCNKDECHEVHCRKRYKVIFEPKDSLGENLFQKSDSLYTKDSIRLLTTSSSVDLSFTSSKVVLILDNSVNQFIIDFSKNKIDTFYVNKKFEESECCGNVNVIESYSVSNQDSLLIDNYDGSWRICYIIP